MPTSPVKPQRSVLFKVTVPTRLEKVYRHEDYLDNKHSVKHYSDKSVHYRLDSKEETQDYCKAPKEETQDYAPRRHEKRQQRENKRTVIATFKELSLQDNKSTDNFHYHQDRKYDERYSKVDRSEHGGKTTVCDRILRAIDSHEEQDVRDDVDRVLVTLKKSSHGRVLYNRHQALSEEDLPPLNQLIKDNRLTKALDRVCSKSSEETTKQTHKSRGRGKDKHLYCKSNVTDKQTQDQKAEEKYETQKGALDMDNSLDCSPYNSLNKTLALIESMEFLNDSMSILRIEQKNKLSGVSHIEAEKRKQDAYFRRSAQLSQDSYDDWSERSRARMQQQVKELRERKSKKDSSIETEYLKMQQYFQKKFEEDQATIKRVEQTEKQKVEEAAEKQKQISVSWNNVITYVLTTEEVVSVAKRCVPDPTVDPEIEVLINEIDQLYTFIVALKTEATKLYEKGALGPQTAVKYENDMHVVYSSVRVGIEKLNVAIKRVNRERAEKAASDLKTADREQTTAGIKTDSTVPQTDSTVPQTDSTVPQSSYSAPPPPGAVPEQTATKSVSSTKVSSEEFVKSNVISTTAFHEYQRLEKQLQELESGIQKFVIDKDKDIMKMRSALKLITVTPINSISASSNQHMANKVTELVSILEGKATTRANKTINPGLNNLTLNYCFHIAASKFVDQACEQVAFSDTLIPAFSIATVLTGIWQRHPRFGELFMAHFCRRCPYIIPANWIRKHGEINTDYLKRIGYSADGDKIEETDKFLQKMEGCVKLYAAIIQTTPPHSNMPHPHGLSYGWLWLSRVLNLQPIPDLTATILEAFLSVAGSALHLHYKSQFLKVLEFLYTSYLPQLEEVTLPTNLGPITRLKLYLEKVKRENRLPAPTGRIEQAICQ